MLRPCFECCMLSIQFHREVIVDSSPASEPLTPHVKNNAQRASLFFCNFQHFCYFDNLLPNFGRNSGYMLCAQDPRGGARDARPPPRGPNSFILQFLAKNWKIITFGSWRPPRGKSDPPLRRSSSYIFHCCRKWCIRKEILAITLQTKAIKNWCELYPSRSQNNAETIGKFKEKVH